MVEMTQAQILIVKMVMIMMMMNDLFTVVNEDSIKETNEYQLFTQKFENDYDYKNVVYN